MILQFSPFSWRLNFCQCAALSSCWTIYAKPKALSGLHYLSFPLPCRHRYWKLLKTGKHLRNLIPKSFLEGLNVVWNTGILVLKPAFVTTSVISWSKIPEKTVCFSCIYEDIIHCEAGWRPQQESWDEIKWNEGKKKNRTDKDLKSCLVHIGARNEYFWLNK